MTVAADQMELTGATVAPDPVNARKITVALITAVYERFAEPEWLCLQQVAIGGRSLDVVAVRMWSRAVIHAFEVKATRSDWLREMRKPEKADAAIGMCDHFWLVAAKGVVKPEEVPEHWCSSQTTSSARRRPLPPSTRASRTASSGPRCSASPTAAASAPRASSA